MQTTFSFEFELSVTGEVDRDGFIDDLMIEGIALLEYDHETRRHIPFDILKGVDLQNSEVVRIFQNLEEKLQTEMQQALLQEAAEQDAEAADYFAEQKQERLLDD